MRRDKLVVVFDEAARKEYLTGFHKRKVERRKVAEEKRKEMEKEARREAKLEVRAAVPGLRSCWDESVVETEPTVSVSVSVRVNRAAQA
jgi:hypothetical protein